MTILYTVFRSVRGKMRPTFYADCSRCGTTFFTNVSMDTLCAECATDDFAATVTPEMMEPVPAPTHAVRTGEPIDWDVPAVGTYCCVEHGSCPEGSRECGAKGCGAEVVKLSSWPRGCAARAQGRFVF